MKQRICFSGTAIVYCCISLGILCFCLVACIANGQWSELADAWEHAATIRELSKDFLNPQHPYFSIPGLTTPRYTSYIFILSLLSRLFNTDAMRILNSVMLVNYAVFTAGVYFFFSYFLKNKRGAVFAIIVLVFFWGKSLYYSNVYSFTNLAVTLFFPSLVSFALCFWGWYFLLRWLRERNKASLVLFIICGMFSFNIHPLTGSLFYLFTVCLLTDRDVPIKPGIFAIILSVILVGASSTFWPYGNFWKDMFSGVSQQFYHPAMREIPFWRIPQRAGFALLGVPLLLWVIKKKIFYSVPLAFLFCFIICILSRTTSLPLIERYVIFCFLFCHFAIIIFLDYLWKDHKNFLKINSMSFLKKMSIVIILAAVLLQINIFRKDMSWQCVAEALKGFKLKQCNDPSEKYEVIYNNIYTGDVVFTDPLTSWIIPALSGAKVIMPYRNIPFNKCRLEQEEDFRIFFSSETSNIRRKKIIKKYNITHVVQNTNFHNSQLEFLNALDLFIPAWEDELLSSLDALSQRVIQSKHLTIFELRY